MARSSWTVRGSVLLVVAVAGLAWWLGRGESRVAAALEVRAAEPIAKPTEVTPLRFDAPQPMHVPDRQAVSPGQAANTGVVRGRVSDADGNPVVGVAVVVRVVLQTEWEPDAEAAGRTDSRGRYALELPAPAWLDQVEVGPGPRTIPSVEDADGDLLPGGDLVVDLTVGAGCVLTGHVVDETGALRSDARVRAWLVADGYTGDFHGGPPDREVETDAAGRFELGLLGPGFVVDAVTANGVSTFRLEGRLDHGRRDLPKPFVIVPARHVPMRALDVNGDPVVVDVRVGSDLTLMTSDASTGFPALGWRCSRESWRTNQHGHAIFGPLRADATYDVSVHDERFPVWTARLEPAMDSIDAVLGAGRSLEGRVLDAYGSPAVGARVLFDLSGGEAETSSDHDGRFRIGGLDGDAIYWAVLHPGHALATGYLRADDEALHVDLEPAATIHLRVLGERGAPVEGARVSLGRHYGQSYWLRDQLPVWSDHEGRIRLDMVTEGRHDLAVRKGRVEVELTASTGPDEHIVHLTPTRPITLAGRVTDSRTGDAVDALITWVEQGISWRSAEGLWERVVEDAPLTLSVTAPGHAPRRIEIEQPGALGGRLDIELDANRPVALSVHDGLGAPVTAMVFARLEDGSQVWLNRHFPSSGVYVERPQILSGLPARRVEFEARNATLGSTTSRWVDLSAEGLHEVQLVLEPGLRRKPRLAVFAKAVPGLGSFVDTDSWTVLQEHRDELVRFDGAFVVEAQGADGQLKARSRFEAATTDQGEGDAARTRLERADVPAVPLTLVVKAAGFRPVEIPWTPGTNGSDYDSNPILVFLEPAAAPR